jgi:hypothetical protein
VINLDLGLSLLDFGVFFYVFGVYGFRSMYVGFWSLRPILFNLATLRIPETSPIQPTVL